MVSVLKVLAAGFIIYACLVGLVWLFQERIAFPAPRRPLPNPTAMGIHDAERVSVTTRDGVRLYGWYLRPIGENVIPDSIRDRGGGRKDASQGANLRPAKLPDPSERPERPSLARSREVEPPHAQSVPTHVRSASERDRDVPDKAGPLGGAPALIWFYGNFETVSVLEPVLQNLRPPGWGILALDIRGYGESEGKPHEAGFYLDAEAAWDFLVDRPEIDSTKIAVYGRSLGSALALHLAATKPVAGVILEAPFTSGPELGNQFYWWVPSFLIRIKMDNISKARKMDAPLLVLHGAEDDIVPLEMGRRIAEAGRADAFMVFEDAGHNDMLMGDPGRYRDEWMAFLSALGSTD